MRLILVIDDNLESRTVLKRLLEILGYRTALAESGESGFAAIAVGKPDLIIVDGMMHGMNGVEFIRLLRADDHTVAIPVILYTAIENSTFVENALEKGANEIWIKTRVTADQMRERLATYFDSGSV